MKGTSRWVKAWPATPLGRVRDQPSARLLRHVAAITGDARVSVLLLAGFFDGISDNWVHGIVLWGAAAAVGTEANSERHAAGGIVSTTPVGQADAVSPPSWRAAVIAGLAVTYAIVVGSWHRYTWPTTAAILLPALLLLVIAWRAPVIHQSKPRSSSGSTRPWVALGIAAGLWELLALVGQPSLTEGSYDHPTFSFLMDSVLANHLGRSLTFLAWLSLGWFLITTTTASPRATHETAPEARRDLA